MGKSTSNPAPFDGIPRGVVESSKDLVEKVSRLSVASGQVWINSKNSVPGMTLSVSPQK